MQVNGGRLLGVVDDDHVPMGYRQFERGIKVAILTFNPSFYAGRAVALASSGIIISDLNTSKINKQERDTREPNNPGATGTKCPQ